MKVAKGLAFFLFFLILFGSCFEAPEYPATPEISFEEIGYWKLAEGDSISITINFKDGDGDLGLDPENPLHSDVPYQAANYFQTNSAGELVPMESESYEQLEIFKPDPNAGDIVFGRTREINSRYASLPPVRCNYYLTTKQFLIEDTTFLHKHTQIDSSSVAVNGKTYYLVTDTVYFERNPNQYNFEIDFFIKVAGQLVEIDFWNDLCATYDGRFPVLNDGKSATEGTLTRGLAAKIGDGFRDYFFDYQVQFRIQIRDRALNTSNVIVSQPRTLAEMRRN